MKTTPLAWFLLLFFLVSCAFQSPAKPTEADRKLLLPEIRSKAENGDAQAQFNLGSYYRTGVGVAKDASEAVKWFRRAAEQGHAAGQCALGSCYANAVGVARDDVEAVKWYRKAAEQGLAEAQYNLGICYHTGEGVTKDPVEAVKWYRKAAEQGFAEAQHNLGVCCAHGEGVTKGNLVSSLLAVEWGVVLGAQLRQGRHGDSKNLSCSKPAPSGAAWSPLKNHLPRASARGGGGTERGGASPPEPSPPRPPARPGNRADSQLLSARFA